MTTIQATTLKEQCKETWNKAFVLIELLYRPILDQIRVQTGRIKENLEFLTPYFHAVKTFMPITIFLAIFIFDVYVFRQYEHVYGDNAPWTSQVFLVLKQFHHFYFTGWNFGTQMFFVGVAIIDEAVRLTEYDPDIENYLNSIRSYVFSALVFPCTLLVSMTFWCLYIYDRELVFPSVIDEFYPKWMNHAVHTVVLIPVITEIFIEKKANFITIESALWGLTTYLLAYQTLYLSIYFFYGIWLYPIFMYMTWVQKMLFLWIEYVLTVSFLTLGIYLQNMKKTVC